MFKSNAIKWKEESVFSPCFLAHGLLNVVNRKAISNLRYVER